MPQDIKEHSILKIDAKIMFFTILCNTKYYKCVFLDTYFCILLNGNSKIGVKFAYMRKKLYLCKLLCASARSREYFRKRFHYKNYGIQIFKYALYS